MCHRQIERIAMDLFRACSRADDGPINPQDPKYQADEKFKPDKESAWEQRPVHRDSWTLSHNAIRGEMKELHGALKAAAGRGGLQPWETKALKDAFAEHSAHVKAHFANGEDVLKPFLAPRIKLDPKLSSKSGKSLECLAKLDEQVGALSGNAEEVLKSFEPYMTDMLDYLGAEEGSSLLLMRAYFTPDEVMPIVQKLAAQSPGAAIGSMVYYAGDDTFSEYMTQESIGNFGWYFNYKGQRDSFKKSFVQNLESVSAGKMPSSCSMFGC
ncbi:unnamed protein product [Effrenium voratum]|nr:unnamed protein product [Effrenium voratum]